MRAALRIAVKDLKLRIRDRSALILGIIAPLVLAFIFNLVFGGAFDASEGLDIRFGVADEDRGDITTGFTQGLAEIEVFDLVEYPGRDAALAAVESNDIDAFFHFSEGFSRSVISGESPAIEVIGNVDSPTSTQIAASIGSELSTGLATSGLALATTSVVSGQPPSPALVAELTAGLTAFDLIDRSADTRQLDPTTYFAAGMAVFFLFFTVQYGVLGLLEEERQGTMARLLAAPVRRVSVVAGKAILAFLLGLIATGTLIIATRLLMGADWGAPLGVAVLAVAGVLAAVGIMGLVAAVAKTPEGAGNVGAIIAVVLGMLGGVFFPIGQGDDLLSRLTFITPHAWFMRGLGDLAGGASWTAALPAAGAILLFAAVTGIIAWNLLMRKLRR